MVFLEKEDKKYIHNCPPNLMKCSFILYLAINQDLTKHVVIMVPMIKLNPLSDPKIMSDPFSNFPYSSMKQNSSFVVWNTRGANNEKFKMNLKEINRNHNFCLIALLEIKMVNHSILKDVFAFDEIFEVPIVGNSERMVLLWHSHMVHVTCKHHTDQEVHVIKQVFLSSHT